MGLGYMRGQGVDNRAVACYGAVRMLQGSGARRGGGTRVGVWWVSFGVVHAYGCMFMRTGGICASDHEGEAVGSTPRMRRTGAPPPMSA